MKTPSTGNPLYWTLYATRMPCPKCQREGCNELVLLLNPFLLCENLFREGVINPVHIIIVNFNYFG